MCVFLQLKESSRPAYRVIRGIGIFDNIVDQLLDISDKALGGILARELRRQMARPHVELQEALLIRLCQLLDLLALRDLRFWSIL